jgi:uncharacterized protein (TIRG00374 family)
MQERADAAMPPRRERPRSRTVGTIVKTAASIAIGVGLLVGVLPRFADLGDVWASIRTMELWQIGSLAAIVILNILSYQLVMMAALPGLPLRHAFMAGQISTAVTNTMPAGSILGVGVTYGVLSSFGHTTADIARAAVLTGWWNALAKFGFPTAALLILALQGGINEGLLSAAAIGLALLAAAIGALVAFTVSDRLARAIGRLAERVVTRARGWFRKPPVSGWEEGFSRFRTQSARLLQARWHLLTIATTASHLSLFFVLWTALRHMGVGVDQITGPEAFGAWAVVQLATALPVTPGGLGVVEVGMAAAMVLAGGEEAPVVAAVLIYRALTYLLQVVLGAVSFAVWRAELRRRPPGSA